MNNLYKLICLDLDGTLLNDKMQISSFSRTGLEKIINHHYECIIISARPVNNILKITEGINFKLLAGLNGAVIFDKINNKILSTTGIQKDISDKLIDFLNKEKITANIFTKNSVYVTKFSNNEINKAYQQDLNPDILLSKKNIHEEILSIELIYDNYDENYNKTCKLKKKFQTQLLINDSNYNYVQINNKYIDKSFALKYISKFLGIPVKKSIAIGDSYSDLSLLKTAGFSAAMKNAAKGLAEYTDTTTKHDNNTHGAVKFLIKFLKL